MDKALYKGYYTLPELSYMVHDHHQNKLFLIPLATVQLQRATHSSCTHKMVDGTATQSTIMAVAMIVNYPKPKGI